MSILEHIISKNKLNKEFDSITIGVVVDTNDVQQMGRIKVYCPAWDSQLVKVEEIPWAMYAAPYGGVSTIISRGSDDNISNGKVAYGAWHIPKIGANVLIMCIDKDPNFRVWMGCIFDQYTTHTMPHGRFLNDNQDGPLTSNETTINPLNDNFKKAFSNDKKYEWKTRIADHTVSAIGSDVISQNKSDNTQIDTNPGYDINRIEPDVKVGGRENLDSQIYSWVTPGFHSFSMDDKEKNCRMRFRTSHGHQIILDDTNERVYIMTAEGSNWIELDQKGNIDLYSDRRISLHAKKDINLTSDETIRFHGNKGIHMSTSDGDIRMDSKSSDIQIKSDKNIIIKSIDNISINSNNINALADNNISLKAITNLNLFGGSTYLTGNSTIDINGGSSVLVTGQVIYFNGPQAQLANSPDILTSSLAYWTNRKPDHEPWSRVIMKNPDNNTEHIPEFNVDDKNVNVIENGESLNRGKNWKR